MFLCFFTESCLFCFGFNVYNLLHFVKYRELEIKELLKIYTLTELDKYAKYYKCFYIYSNIEYSTCLSLNVGNLCFLLLPLTVFF